MAPPLMGFPNHTGRVHKIGDSSAIHRHSNHTGRVHKLGDSSALHRRSQSYREGHTKLAIAPLSIGVPNHTENIPKFGDSSAFHRRSQSHRAGYTTLPIAPPSPAFPIVPRGTQNWRQLRLLPAFPIMERGDTGLATAPPVVGAPIHTGRGTPNWQ